MQIVLISTYVYPVALGMRYVSAYLKQAGYTVKCLHMCSHSDKEEALSQPLVADLVEHCRDADVIGLSLMTNSFYRSVAITDALRQANIKSPIIWGGTHPTVAPEESAAVADYVCVGEGEKAMLEFIRNLEAGKDLKTTRGFAYQENGELVTNPVYPLEDDLDSYPFPDYQLEGHWVADGPKLVPARLDLLRGVLRRYRMSSTRGCPFTCSFCNNATQLNLYRQAGFGRHWVRKRSNASILAEIESIRSQFPTVKEINLIDDLFLIRSEQEVAEFVRDYRVQVNLPIEIDAFPTTITDAKIELLSGLPIALLSMGIQSGSPETLRNMYNRPTRVERVAESIRIIAKHRLPAEYHYLICNPFETDESLAETLRFAASYHHGPAKLRLFPLQFYPGSVMYRKAREAGVIGDRHEEAYRFVYTGKRHITQARYLEIWLMLILSLRNAGVPPWAVHRVVDFAVHPWIRGRLDKKWFAPLGFGIYRVVRGLHKNLIYKPFVRPIESWRTRRQRKRSALATGVPAHQDRARSAA